MGKSLSLIVVTSERSWTEPEWVWLHTERVERIVMIWILIWMKCIWGQRVDVEKQETDTKTDTDWERERVWTQVYIYHKPQLRSVTWSRIGDNERLRWAETERFVFSTGNWSLLKPHSPTPKKWWGEKSDTTVAGSLLPPVVNLSFIWTKDFEELCQKIHLNFVKKAAIYFYTLYISQWTLLCESKLKYKKVKNKIKK